MISLKVVQTLSIVIGSRSLELVEEVLSQALLVCLVTISSSSSRNTPHKFSTQKMKLNRNLSSGTTPPAPGRAKVLRVAAATLKQIIGTTFDRAASLPRDRNLQPGHFRQDAGGGEIVKIPPSPNIHPTSMAAIHVFMDLRALAENRDLFFMVSYL